MKCKETHKTPLRYFGKCKEKSKMFDLATKQNRPSTSISKKKMKRSREHSLSNLGHWPKILFVNRSSMRLGVRNPTKIFAKKKTDDPIEIDFGICKNLKKKRSKYT